MIRASAGRAPRCSTELRAPGLRPRRVDGTFTRSTTRPPLDKHKKHTIEVVVDRFKVRDISSSAWPNPFETALAPADGMADRLDGRRRTTNAIMVLSAKFACPVCGHSRRSWSRACSRSTTRSAPARPATAWASSSSSTRRVVATRSLSLAAGAPFGWDRRNAYYYQMIRRRWQFYGFDLDDRGASLPEERAR